MMYSVSALESRQTAKRTHGAISQTIVILTEYRDTKKQNFSQGDQQVYHRQSVISSCHWSVIPSTVRVDREFRLREDMPPLQLI
jgi:hypothetical protein